VSAPVDRRLFPALTGLRTVAALWVVVYHVAGPLSGPYEGSLKLVFPIFRSGWLGVDLFFVLSGFVITHSYVDRLGLRPRAADIGHFLWARLARVWPVWVLVSTVFAIVLLSLGDPNRADSYSAPVTWWNTVDQLLMVQLWSSDQLARTSYVVPGWSLSAEWLAYVCFPALALLLYRLRRLPWWLLAGGSVSAMVPFAYLCVTRGDTQDAWQLRIAAGFLAGALMCLAVRRVRLTPRIERLAAVVAVTAAGELLITCWWSAALAGVSRAGVAVLVFPVLVGALALSREGLARALSTPLMQVGGRISYSLYLLHTTVFLIFEYVARAVPPLVPGGTLYRLLLPQVILLTIPLSYLLWRYVEEPARRWMMAHEPRLGRRPGTGRVTDPGVAGNAHETRSSAEERAAVSVGAP
jgi:peptidoglycan/LPS O-acetylase OafA/YrhL